MIWDAVVIGSGVGGLACAAALAAKGRKVVILEQGASPGGYLVSFRRGQFIFDAAVDCFAGLDPGGVFTWLLNSLGIDEEIRRIRIDPIHVSLFPGLNVRVDACLGEYVNRLCRLFPAERKGIVEHFRCAGEIYDDFELLTQLVLEEGGGGPRMPSIIGRYRDLTFSAFLEQNIKDRRVAAILSDRCPFLGLSPRRVSAVRMVLLVMSYFRSGAFRTAGGHQRLPDILVEGIRRKGGEFLPRKAAKKIIVEGGRCTRVITEDGEEFPAWHVVSNADHYETMHRLLGKSELTTRRDAEGAHGISPSFFILYAAVSGDLSPPEGASSIGAFHTFDLDSLLDGYIPFRQTEPLGITIPTVEDPSLAPEGHHVVIVHELIPHGYQVDWGRDKRVLAEKLLQKAERVLPGLSGRIVHFEAATPETLARYTRNRDGAAFGWEQTPTLPRVRHGIPNLHLAGHWTEVGGGVLAAAYSGVRAAARVVEATG